MKHELRIPTLEPYAYLNIAFEGTPDEALEEYRRITLLVKEPKGTGLNQKDFNHAVDEYLRTGTLSGALYLGMDEYQQGVLQILKRSRGRLKDKITEVEEIDYSRGQEGNYPND